MTKKALFFIELGAGVVAAFALWSYVSPYLSQVNTTPSA